ncbi:hypothetical protein GCM10011328_27850 [Hafnia psychrotolerans]|uniref:Uncharacterized protein n=1 Tax=Hafnia psychrotolerans TaxID=1477018 RepID=A0ABQ1GVH0_9GAMM|nr:hypothetical protein GCM10011328_27850 [Hafnia psychrotolerans]
MEFCIYHSGGNRTVCPVDLGDFWQARFETLLYPAEILIKRGTDEVAGCEIMACNLVKANGKKPPSYKPQSGL